MGRPTNKSKEKHRQNRKMFFKIVEFENNIDQIEEEYSRLSGVEVFHDQFMDELFELLEIKENKAPINIVNAIRKLKGLPEQEY